MMRIQWIPNLVRSERRICLTRLVWEMGKVGDGKGTSNKVSFSLAFKPKYFCVGIVAATRQEAWSQFQKAIYIVFLPCIALRINITRAWGGYL